MTTSCFNRIYKKTFCNGKLFNTLLFGECYSSIFQSTKIMFTSYDFPTFNCARLIRGQTEITAGATQKSPWCRVIQVDETPMMDQNAIKYTKRLIDKLQTPGSKITAILTTYQQNLIHVIVYLAQKYANSLKVKYCISNTIQRILHFDIINKHQGMQLSHIFESHRCLRK